MKITGIVIEYNPFHNGHKHHIDQTRTLTRPDVLVGVMSGHFVQRGEMAIIDKWQRTKTAIEHGVDLIFELPTLFALQAAQEFANGAIDILHQAQISDLVFGSESNDLQTILEIADLPIHANNIKESMKTGMAYPKALSLYAPECDPNDILGIAYAKAAKNTNIQLHTIQRTNAYHGEELDDAIASATAIRKAVKLHQNIQCFTPMHQLNDLTVIPDWELYYPLLRYKLLSTPKTQLQDIFLVSEGIETHLMNMALKHDSFALFVDAAVNRRYSKARIQRVCSHILLNTTKHFAHMYPKKLPLRVLGFNQQGLKALQYYKSLDIKIASRFNQMPKSVRGFEYHATNIYTLPLDPKDRAFLLEREVGPPIMLLGETP